MEIVLFILLVGVWAAFVLPSFFSSKRETPVDRRTGAAASMTGHAADLHRQRVLARRRMALAILIVLALGTLVGAVLTGSFPLLIVTLLVDVGLAGYVAMLLMVKQNHTRAPHPMSASDEAERLSAISY
jgi:type II secretory pathway pseudopilin PulG